MTIQLAAISGASGFGLLVGVAAGVSTAAASGLAAAPMAISGLADYFIDKAVENNKISIKTAFVIKISTLILLTAATIAAGIFIVGPIAGALLAIPLLIKVGFVCVSHYRSLKAEVTKKTKLQKLHTSLNHILNALKIIADCAQTEFKEIEPYINEAKNKETKEFREASYALGKKKQEIDAFISKIENFERWSENILKNDRLYDEDRTELRSFMEKFVLCPFIFDDIEFVETLFNAGILHPEIITKRKNITETSFKPVLIHERMKFKEDQLAKVHEFIQKFDATARKLEQRTQNAQMLSTVVAASLSTAKNAMSRLAKIVDEIKNMNEETYDEKKIKGIDSNLQSIYEILHNRILMLCLESCNIELTDIPFYQEVANPTLT